jgi:hypothetical protein
MAMSTRHLSDSPPLVITTSTADLRCHWSDDDELVLINFLLDHKAEAGDGGSFKANIWNAAAIEMLKHTWKGGPKIAGKCKAKYVAVRCEVHPHESEGEAQREGESLILSDVGVNRKPNQVSTG